MSENETIIHELSELKALVKQLIPKEKPKKDDWVNGSVACLMLGIKQSTLASYRHKRMIEFRSPRPYQYNVKSIEALLIERTIKKAI